MAHKPRKYKSYPKPQDIETGMKVSWYYYAKEQDAELAAVAARHNAAIKSGLGYDFGYCAPGDISIVKRDECPFRVCIP